MAPSSGHLLLPKIWRAARFAYETTSRAIRAKFPASAEYLQPRLQPAYARLAPRQPINRAAAIRQARSRHFSTTSAGTATRTGWRASASTVASYQSSRIGSALTRLTSHSPFASALRPNLTGGTLGRSAGGYAIGAGRLGGARYFSNAPAAPAQVVTNVSAAMRAFFLSGQKARFDGIDPITGEKRFKVVTKLQDKAQGRMAALPRDASGSYVDFQLSPIITAFGQLKCPTQEDAADKVTGTTTLNSEGLMNLLAVDLARAVKGFAGVMNDLNRLSTLGELPVSMHDKSTIRVRFPGCDADQVARLCDEVGVQRGRISQDEDFDRRNGAELALLFPFAPSVPPTPVTELYTIHDASRDKRGEELDWRRMMSVDGSSLTTQPSNLTHPTNELSFEDVELFEKNPWRSSSSGSGYSSINISELGDRAFFPDLAESEVPNSTSEYEGVQGIYRFLEECNRAEGEFRRR